MFSYEFLQNFQEHLFYRTPPATAFENVQKTPTEVSVIH